MIIRGTTALVAHIGFPTDGFVSPLIYNPYFEAAGIDAVVVPMGCRTGGYPAFLRALFTLSNIRGALVTMPHKMTRAALVDEASLAVQVAGSYNAVRRLPMGACRATCSMAKGSCVRSDATVAGLRARGRAPLVSSQPALGGQDRWRSISSHTFGPKKG